MYKADFYILRNITNLHAGAGDNSYGTIDKRVQRDPATGRPCIFSSALKGSLREFFEENYWLPEAKEGGKRVKTNDLALKVFGSSVKEEGNQTSQGKYRFLQAQLLSLPVRSNFRPYFNATCPSIVKEFKESAELAGHTWTEEDKSLLNFLSQDIARPGVFDEIPANQKVFVEDKEASSFALGSLSPSSVKRAENIFGPHLALIPDGDFQDLHENLPVIPRNQLENGESKNLWYEEVVPREARFFVGILRPNDSVADFDINLKKNTVQIGANATIGYGICKFYSL